MSGTPFGGREPLQAEHNVSLRMSGFAWEAIERECARQGVSVDELVAFAVMYYMADADSGRISRQISRSPYPGTGAPEESAPEASPPDDAS